MDKLRKAVTRALMLESSYGKPYLVSIACRLCVLAEQGNVDAARLIWEILNSQRTGRKAERVNDETKDLS